MHSQDCTARAQERASERCYRGPGYAWTLLLAGCAGEQSTLDPQGPVANDIAALWWMLCGGALGILILVMAAVSYAMFRRPDRRTDLPVVPFLIGAGLVIPTVVLTALLVYTTELGRRITAPAADPLRIEIVGHRWWWEIRYPADGDLPEVLTANELWLPLGVPVEFAVASADVIHSFWIPSLAGKVDMIPGRTNVLRLRADERGSFRAQCSEFCGMGHAHMGFRTTVDTQARFTAWRIARAAPAAIRTGPALALFVDRGCGECHTIAGTRADGVGAPTLTHLAARPTLGATAIRNTPRALRDWLADHGRTLKPGSLGPRPRDLEAADVEALATLLETLH